MKNEVLFLCAGNSCRSQMAEGWLRYLASDRFEVASAGTCPVGLNLTAVEVMREAGIDISSHRSKHLQRFAARRFDYAITVCDQARKLARSILEPPQFYIGVLMIRHLQGGKSRNDSRCFGECTTKSEPKSVHG